MSGAGKAVYLQADSMGTLFINVNMKTLCMLSASPIFARDYKVDQDCGIRDDMQNSLNSNEP